ncbi:MAG: aldehyde dehydrogenase (NADP(+)) [Terriglobia bacterium]
MEQSDTRGLHGQNQIGASLSAQGEKTFKGFNPRTSEWLEPPFHQAASREIDAACALAGDASPKLRQMSGEAVAAFLDTIAEELLALGDQWIERASAESGLDRQRLTGERTRTVNQARLFAELVKEGSWVDARIDRALPDRKPAPRPDLRRMLVAIGPVAVFGASNFPLAFSVAGGDTISALAARNPVVVKAHPAHPGTSEVAAEAIRRATAKRGLPEGAFSMVHGIDPEISLALVRHPAIRAIAFTGSLRAGRALFDAAAERPEPIPMFAEMGSVNPVFLLPGALEENSDEITRGLANSINLGVGQFCTCPGLVVGRKGSAFERFAANLRSNFDQASPATMLHPGILKGYREGVERARSVPGVTARASALQADPTQTAATPVLLETDAVTWLDHRELSEEIFGPASILIHSASPEELLRIARALPGGLTASVFGNRRDLDEHRELVAMLETKAGRLLFNGYPTGVEVTHAMQHGGPYPATTDSRFTSVGTAAILRFARPVCYQNFPESFLPPELRDENPLGIWRMIDGHVTKDSVGRAPR